VSTDVTVEQEIGRPRGDVAAYAADWRNDPGWIGALTDVELVSDGEFDVGSQVKRVASFLGRRIEYVNEVVAWERGERLVMRSVKAPFPMKVTYEWSDASAGTRMRIRAEGDAGGFYRFAGPLLSLMVRRGIASDLKRLRERLESR
jgi:hypothetical protein